MDVTHSQKDSQPDWRDLVRVEVAIDLKKGYVVVRGGTEYSIPTLPSRVGMKDYCLDTLFSLGEACKDGRENPTRPCIYIKGQPSVCQHPCATSVTERRDVL